MRNDRGFFALLRKEVVLAVTNQAFILLFGVPVVVTTFLGLAFSSDRQAAAAVALVLPSASGQADRLASAVRALPTLRVTATPSDAGEALALAREGRVVAVIDLTEAHMGPQGPEGSIVVTVDETRPVLAEIVRATLEAWLSGSGNTSAGLRFSLLRGVSPRDSSIPLWLLISILSVSLGSVPLLMTDEKEHRTLNALLVTPLGAPSIVLAKALVGIAAILVMGGLIVVLNRTSVADPLLLGVILVIGAASMVFLGLLIGALAPNQATAAPIASVVFLLLILPVLLGELATTPIGIAAQALPTYHVSALLSASVFGGATLNDTLTRLLYLAAFGLAGGLLTVWSVQRDGV
ncbi:MAG: ABC transporter permease [Chloroflexi bacterium]|nr:ABC transporter permease [Chloroflexota bacterium]